MICLIQVLAILFLHQIHCFKFNLKKMSYRVANTERPHIEDVLDEYSQLPDLTMLALGSVYWNPPAQALKRITEDLNLPGIHKYGGIMGESKLREHLTHMLQKEGLDMTDLDLVITAGANQAINNVALSTCDEGDNVIILAPYYFPHKSSAQLCGAKVSICPYDPSTLAPDWNALENLIETLQPKLVSIKG